MSEGRSQEVLAQDGGRRAAYRGELERGGLEHGEEEAAAEAAREHGDVEQRGGRALHRGCRGEAGREAEQRQRRQHQAHLHAQHDPPLSPSARLGKREGSRGLDAR